MCFKSKRAKKPSLKLPGQMSLERFTPSVEAWDRACTRGWGTYWAYAQWPSREALENAAIEGHETLMEARKRMVDACESMEVFGEGNIVHDLFVKEG